MAVSAVSASLSNMDHTNGLQRASGPSTITTVADYERNVRRWQEDHAHILSPAISFSGLPAQHELMASMVKLNPDPSAGDVYQDNLFIKGQDVAIAKIGLSKIAQCAGISIDTERTDTRTVPHYWEVKATATWIGFDGTPQRCQATVEYDLRDGSPRLKGFTANQIEQARKHGMAGAETRAINRAIRQFGIRQKYTKQELEKPFVVLRVRFVPDMSDPVTRAAVVQQKLAGTSALYPHAALPPITAPAAESIDGEVVASAAAPLPSGPVETAAPEPRYTITKVLKQPQADGSVKFYVQTDRTGDRLLDATEATAVAAAGAKKNGQSVELDIEASGDGASHIVEIRVLASGTLPPATEL